jgi:hypothetical protein
MKNILILILAFLAVIGCNPDKTKKNVQSDLTLTMNPDLIDSTSTDPISEMVDTTGANTHYTKGKPVEKLFGERHHYIINEDSIEVKNNVRFGRYKYPGDQYKEQDAVIITLEVTNRGNKLIPDIQTARWRGKIRIIIDGQDAMWMSLANMSFGGDQSLPKDSTESWPWELQIAGPNAIDYGDVFTWQWEYMGIKSPIVQVDVKNRKFDEVDQHIKTDKKFY